MRSRLLYCCLPSGWCFCTLCCLPCCVWPSRPSPAYIEHCPSAAVSPSAPALPPSFTLPLCIHTPPTIPGRDVDVDYDVGQEAAGRYGTRATRALATRAGASRAQDPRRKQQVAGARPEGLLAAPGGGGAMGARGGVRLAPGAVPGPVIWSKGEDDLLLAITHEFGVNWTMVRALLAACLHNSGTCLPAVLNSCAGGVRYFEGEDCLACLESLWPLMPPSQPCCYLTYMPSACCQPLQLPALSFSPLTQSYVWLAFSVPPCLLQVSEVLSLSLSMQGIFRPPHLCKQRFRQITVRGWAVRGRAVEGGKEGQEGRRGGRQPFDRQGRCNVEAGT